MKGFSMKVGMLILLQPNIEQAVEFYNSIGLTQKFHIKEKWAEFAIGDIKLCLCPTSQEFGEHHTGIVIEVEDLMDTYERFRHAGVPFMNEPVEAVHGVMVSFKDPAGNIIDLYQPTPDRVQELIKKTAENSDNADLCCKNNGNSCANECNDNNECDS
jgi:predicted enzyme related to lactoylglutathione lyase